MDEELIEQQYRDSRDLYEYLMSEKQISFAEYVNAVYAKVLLISVASFFEAEISRSILCYASQVVTKRDKRLIRLIEIKVIKRQYHTLFDWNASNANAFWNLFGDDVRYRIRQDIDSQENLKNAEKDFIFLGQQRNVLVHENFAKYNMNLTNEEIYKKYNSAKEFVRFVKKVLNPAY